jgi:hypothetical protein
VQIRPALVALILAVVVCGAASGEKLNNNLDAIKAAMDPSNGPPIVEPVYPAKHPFPEFGGPGPYMPLDATRMGLGGIAVIQCVLALSGKLRNCTLIAEAPLRFEFGAAALVMASSGYLKATPPTTFNDGREVRVIVVFNPSHSVG